VLHIIVVADKPFDAVELQIDHHRLSVMPHDGTVSAALAKVSAIAA
jgi:hypothetical protein